MKKAAIILDIICCVGWVICAIMNFADGSMKMAVVDVVLAVLWIVITVINIHVFRNKKD